MADSENTEAESVRQESKEAVQEAETREPVKGEPDKKKTTVGAKVEVRLQAAGDAPIMKTRNYNVSESSELVANLYKCHSTLRLIERSELVGLLLSLESI